MTKIIVLGAGMVGSAMAIDLSKKYDVTVADLSGKALDRLKEKCPAVNTQQLNAKDKALLIAAINPFDIVVCAVPGFMGFETLKTIIETGKNVVDISFFLKIHWNWMRWRNKKA